MRTLLVTAFVSVDGVVQAPGGPDEDRDGGFAHGGWAVPHLGPEVVEAVAELITRADALLLGRRTYEVFAESWPLAADDDPIGAKLNAVPKHVASRTLTEVTWRNSALLTGDVADAVAALKRDGDGEVQVHGSGDLVQTLLAHDLVDEFHLVVLPVLVGSGKRLFGAGTAPAALRPVRTVALGNAVATTYARAGGLEYGAMGPETGNW
ncbi:dihydrofolate reductase family protein [Saccharothrix xinjiangensis]|uniref:Dihydrofolate reductase family protein n=1 Tax=Saccharothrix xinjiangensis TaxID=204798 RepID=A0ABV9Y470_9PSEU